MMMAARLLTSEDGELAHLDELVASAPKGGRASARHNLISLLVTRMNHLLPCSICIIQRHLIRLKAIWCADCVLECDTRTSASSVQSNSHISLIQCCSKSVEANKLVIIHIIEVSAYVDPSQKCLTLVFSVVDAAVSTLPSPSKFCVALESYSCEI